LGALRIANGEVHAKIMGRSLDSKEGDELRNKTAKLLSEAFDKQISTSCTIPIWEAKEGSLLEDTATKAYPKVSNGQKTSTIIETGGLETAIFTQKKPNLQQISIGPTIEDPHSVQERVKVDTIGPFYNWLSKILEMLPKD